MDAEDFEMTSRAEEASGGVKKKRLRVVEQNR